MLVIADDLFIAAVVQFGQSAHPLPDCPQFAKQTLLGPIAVSEAMQTFTQCLMNGRSLADPLAARQFGGRTRSVQNPALSSNGP